MIASAAHTSKGLAKAFVSSAGAKGPEDPLVRSPAPLIGRPEAPPTAREQRKKL